MINPKPDKLEKIERPALKFRLRNPYRSKTAGAPVIVIVLFFLLLLPAISYAQSGSYFDVKSIIKDMQKQYKLNSKDLRSLSPLINEENRKVLLIYVRFSGGEPEYSFKLWQEIIKQRMDFETLFKGGFSQRQEAALRSARTELEKRILSYLVEDYVSFLGQTLELNIFELEALQKLFDLEQKKIHELILKDTSRPLFLQLEMEKITEATERRLEKILSPEQLRDYRSLFPTDQSFIA